MSRTILVTGATGGLGKTVVAYFLAQGDYVHAVDLAADGQQSLSELPSDKLQYHACNITDPTDVAQLIDKLETLDVLVNLVGGFAWQGFAETTVETLEKMLHLNLSSCFVMTQHCLALIKRSPAGRIINVGARQALAGGAMVSAYALSKAAVINLTQSLAAELKDFPITVNAVVPSTIDTPANRQSMPDADFDKWVQPTDLAVVIQFLASEAARAVSGAIIPVYHKA